MKISEVGSKQAIFSATGRKGTGTYVYRDVGRGTVFEVLGEHIKPKAGRT